MQYKQLRKPRLPEWSRCYTKSAWRDRRLRSERCSWSLISKHQCSKSCVTSRPRRRFCTKLQSCTHSSLGKQHSRCIEHLRKYQ